MAGFQAVLLLPQVHPLRSFVKTNIEHFVKNGEMVRSKKPAERSGLKTCGFRTERGKALPSLGRLRRDKQSDRCN